MNRITNLFIVTVLLASAFLVGCSREELLIPNTTTQVEQLPDGSLRIPLTLNPVFPQVQEVQTRTSYSDEESRIESVYVLVFEATDDQPLPDGARLLQNVRAVAGGAAQAYVTLAPYAGKCQMRVLTNLSSDVASMLEAFQTVDVNPSTPTTFSQFKDLQFGINAFYDYVTNPGCVTNPPYTMSSERIYLESISPETTNNLTANLFMGAARIDISVDPSVTDFTLYSARLLNGAQKGYLRPRPLGELPINLGGTVQYCDFYPAGNKFPPIYLLENNGALPSQIQGTNATFLILKAEVKTEFGYIDKRFFKLVVRYDKEGADHYDIVRNTLYDIRITAVRNGGYESEADAVANTPANIEYDITVNDGTSTDIVIGNGQYYMGLSNSEVLYYAEPKEEIDAEEIVLATLTLGTAPGQTLPSALSRTITTDAVGEMQLTTTSMDLNVASGVAVEIKAKILKQNIDKKVIINIGNLVKTIRVQSKDRIFSLENNFIAVNDVVQAMVSHNSDNNFLRLATTSSSYPATYSSELRNSGPSTVYLCVPPSSNTLRTAEVYLSRAGKEGRVKAIVEQKLMDPSTLPIAGLSNSYVGAFWRATQTGERIIRIQTPSGEQGAWDAQVIWKDDNWGDDKVLFSTATTNDPNVSFTDSDKTAADMNNPANDALYNVNGGSLFASGTTIAGGNIHFRLGITSQNNNVKPRYAVVLLRYADFKKNHLIYLRQGEQADYLFLTTDPYGNGSNGLSGPNWRPDARKFSPYNLTDPSMGAGGSALASHNQLAVGGGAFTAYPSHAGAFFQWAGATPRKAFHPTNPAASVFITSFPGTAGTSYWDTYAATHETCPSGYRRPNDGTISTTATGVVAGSEMRQSLYLNPNAGIGITDATANSVWGYYADGYFDRRKIQSSATTEVSSAVSPTTKDVAYCGYLFFNPNNYASIFLPAAGMRSNSNGRLFDAGNTGYYWSSSVQSTSNSGLLYFRSGYVSQTKGAQGSGISVRCIRQ